jgi:hypothetical protein
MLGLFAHTKAINKKLQCVVSNHFRDVASSLYKDNGNLDQQNWGTYLLYNAQPPRSNVQAPNKLEDLIRLSLGQRSETGPLAQSPALERLEAFLYLPLFIVADEVDDS